MPRSGWFRGSPPLVRTDQVPKVIRDRIAALNLSESVSIYSEQTFPAETGKVSPPWSRISVWLRREGSKPSSSPTGQTVVVFGVQTEVADDPQMKAGWDYLRVSADLHDLIFAAINGRNLATADDDTKYAFREETLNGTVLITHDVQPIRAIGFTTEAPQRDDRNNTWVHLCEYNAVLVRKPKEIP